ADGSGMLGIIAFREGWIDQLYVLPTTQRRGIGSALLQIAQSASPRLELWTFQRNAPRPSLLRDEGLRAGGGNGRLPQRGEGAGRPLFVVAPPRASVIPSRHASAP